MKDSITARAWNATKTGDDLPFDEIPNGQFKGELEERAAAVQRTGLTIDAFEEKVKELSEKAKAEEPETPLGTKNQLGDQPAESGKTKSTESEDAAEVEASDLAKMTRAELDEIATSEFGFNPSDYSNKAEIVAAIEEARAK